MGDAARDDLLRRVSELEWYHRIDLGNGIETPGREYERYWNPTLEFMRGCRFDGKRVLDVGCWDGMFSFEAERWGAAEVVATDIQERPTFELAAAARGSRVRFRRCSVYRLAREFPPESFDIVVFNGVLYHLMAPLLALVAINRVLRPDGVLLLESAFYNRRTGEPLVFVSYGEDQLYEGDASSCSFPTARCFDHLLEMSLFSVERKLAYLKTKPTGRLLIEARRRAWRERDQLYELLFDVF